MSSELCRLPSAFAGNVGAPREPISKEWRTALVHELNPGLSVDADGGLVWQHDRGVCFVSRSMDKQQFAFRLPCGRHVRVLTPHGACAVNALVCPWCEYKGMSGHEGQVERQVGENRFVSAAERSFAAAEDALGLGEEFAFQVAVPWWKGLLDFVHLSSGLAWNVDGSIHFEIRFHNVPASDVREDDIKCNAAAWNAGWPLVRVHHEDTRGVRPLRIVRAILDYRARFPQGPLLVLSPAYRAAACGDSRSSRNLLYIHLLLKALPGSQMTDGPAGCIIFKPVNAM